LCKGRYESGVISVLTDVSKAGEVESLAKTTLDTYGMVNLLVNNAGIGNTKFTWEYTLKDWEWQLGVNLWGVIHGVRIFAPIMLNQGDECHIVNVASMEGLFSGSGPGGCIYGVSKHGVVSMTETFRTDLELKGITNLKVSVVCPGFVNTRIFFGDIHRPEDFQNSPDKQVESIRGSDYMEKMAEKFQMSLDELPQMLMSSTEAADLIFQGIMDEKLYILTHKDELMRSLTKERFDEILKEFDI
jgi:NAD(P)-dependent dehydrogenase (short-subunit alcohol dehydrogenase family)